MTPHNVQVQLVGSLPLAVVRRQARPSDLARVVPECCGLVSNALRAQQVRAGRNVAVNWDDGIRLEVGVEVKPALGGPRADGNLAFVRSPTRVC